MNNPVIEATWQTSSETLNGARRETPPDDCGPAPDQSIGSNRPDHESQGRFASGPSGDDRVPGADRSGSLVGSALVALERRHRLSRFGSSGTVVAGRTPRSGRIDLRASTGSSDTAALGTDGARSVGSGASGRSARDRRAYPRHESPARVSVVLLSEGDRLGPVERSWKLHASRLQGTLVDVSMNGAALLLPRPVPPGQHVLLRLYNPHRDLFVDVAGRVLRNATASPGRCKVVCVLERRLTWEEINALGKHLFSSSVV